MSEIVRLRDLVREAIAALGGGAEARTDAEVLAAHAFGLTRAQLIARDDAAPASERVADYRSLVARRARGEPVAYIVGRREFWSLDLEVTPDVLIPRPETERLVELALERIDAASPVRVADLGTGSGAIALAIARERPRAWVVGVDVSRAVLEVARRNAARNRVANVEFVAGDWFAPLNGTTFDLVVSNPPYVAELDPHLEAGDCRFEPRGALASGAEGVDDIRRIAAGARAHLVGEGWLLLEHGFDQADAVRGILREGGYAAVESWTDLGGRWRVTGGRAPRN